MPLHAILEAILFYKAEPLSVADLALAANASHTNVREALQTLERELAGRGIVLIMHNDTALLATAPEAAGILSRLARDELERSLSKPALETLAVILYHGPISRPQIDYIRGVNSQWMLRTLLTRGLIEKTQDSEQERGTLYRPTIELLAHLGLAKPEDLPEYEKIGNKVAASEASTTEEAALQEA